MYINPAIFKEKGETFFSLIRTNIEYFVEVSDEEFLYFLTILKIKKINKGEFISKKGVVNDHMVFINSGGIRYFEEYKENDFTIDFVFEGEWCGDYQSFITRQPSLYNVQALEDSEVLVLNFEDNLKLHEKYVVFERWAKKLTEAVFFEALNRLTQVKRNTPEENYLQLIKQRPYIFERVKIQHIASYLGIAPQSLSRIRKRINQ